MGAALSISSDARCNCRGDQTDDGQIYVLELQRSRADVCCVTDVHGDRKGLAELGVLYSGLTTTCFCTKAYGQLRHVDEVFSYW